MTTADNRLRSMAAGGWCRPNRFLPENVSGLHARGPWQAAPTSVPYLL